LAELLNQKEGSNYGRTLITRERRRWVMAKDRDAGRVKNAKGLHAITYLDSGILYGSTETFLS
jgi:hypothetical protein